MMRWVLFAARCLGMLGGLALAAAGGGCAAGSLRATPTGPALPESPGAAQHELQQLEQQLAAGRLRLGLPAADDAAVEAPPPGPVSTRPQDPCREVRAICHAAERICVLADYLAEPDARARCALARESCVEARRATGCP